MLIYEFGSHKYFTYFPELSFIKASQSIGYDSGHWIYSTPGLGNVSPFLSVVANVKVRFMSTLLFLLLYRLFTLSSIWDKRLEFTFCREFSSSLYNT
mgnify:CR=1 FL=1